MAKLPKHFLPKESGLADKSKMITGKKYRITVITSRLFRFEYDEDGKFCDEITKSVVNRNFAKTDFKVHDDGQRLTVTTEDVSFTYDKTGPFSKDNLEFTLLDSNRHWFYKNKTRNLKGTTRTLDTINGACPLGEGVCSEDGFAFFEDAQSVIIGKDGMIEQRPNYDVDDTYVFAYGDNCLLAVQDYFRLTGIPPLLPAFAMGNWWSRYYKYTEKSYIELMQKFFDEELPFSVAVIDMDWHRVTDIPKKYGSGWTGYSWNKDFFPDYKRFLKWLCDHNLKPSLNLHPADGVRGFEDMYPEMAKAMGIDPKTDEQIKFDMSNPKFVENYFKILHNPYEDDGVRFWWMDWQQGTKATIPNVDPLWVLNHYHTLDSKRDGKREIIFSRFSGPGAQRHPVGFSGDTHITWDSLDFQPYFTATASNIGYPWWSHDIGGHMCGYRDDELNARWVQLGAFSPINRLHSSNSPFSSREPWNYNLECEASTRKYLKLRHSMFPYLYSMNYRCHFDLEPMVQPMYYKWWNAFTLNIIGKGTKNQYLFGSELMVAPITTPASKTSTLGCVRMYLPQGKWFDFENGLVYTGKPDGVMINVHRKFDVIPVFAKPGAIVPMNRCEKFDNRNFNMASMDVLVFPGADNSFTIYDDDGDTYGFEEGKVGKTVFDLKYEDKKALFTVNPVEGDDSFTVPERKYNIKLRGFMKDSKVKAVCDGKTVRTRLIYDKENNTTTVVLPSLSTKSKIEVTVTNQKGLIHDNSDVLDKVFEIVLRSQIDYQQKADIYESVRCAKSRADAMKYVVDYNGDSDTAEAIIELLSL